MLVAVELFLINSNQIKMKHLFTLIALFGLSLFAQNVPNYVPTNGLVGWWPFNGNANDLSGNGNNGTVNNAALTADRDGVAGSAYEFNGNPSEFISTNYYGIFGSNPRTITFWAALDNSADMTAISYGSNNNGQRFTCGFNYSSPGVTAGIAQASATYAPTSPLTGWNHFAFVYEPVFGSNVTSIKVYQNGQVLNNLIHSGYTNILLNTASGSPLSIGKNLNTLYQAPFDGKIDDVGFWSRALSQQEIDLLFVACNDSIIYNPQNFTAYSSPGWANFKCKSTDTSATFQWQQNNGTGWTNLTNFGIFSGTNSDSLVINGITGAMNNYGYRCLVTGCESDTSETATLFVSNGVSLNEGTLDALTLSPNPTSGIVRFNQPIEGTYRVIASDGRVVQKGEMGEAIDLSAYPDGTYQIEVQSSNERRTFKAVKHR
jgi:hypothetical protein